MSKTNYNEIYQFNISLKNIKPPVWRRIQVPSSCTFWDLHVAIQESFGWTDLHLHEFTTIDNNYNQVKRIGMPDEEMMTSDVLPGWEEKISAWFSLDKNRAMNYTYDFGDNWEHRVALEKIIPKQEDVSYPVCIKGKRACPPEDCGGPWGYADKLRILKNPEHPEYQNVIEWMGDDFNPEEFACDEIIFSEPLKRLADNDLIKNIKSTKASDKEIKQEPKRKTSPKMIIEIDYGEISHYLIDETGNKIKPLILIIVNPDSYFILGSHLASPKSDYLHEFFDKILEVIKNGPFAPEKILVKKKELFDLLNSSLKEMNIELEMVERTRAVESVKKEMGRYFKN